MQVPTDATAEDLGWLWASPNGTPPPAPVETRTQILPLSQLDWRDFERLCVRLAEQDADVEQCHIFGVPGQAQQGIDLLVRSRTAQKYETWQCKRYTTLDPSDIAAAVARFMTGPWLSRSSRFHFATSAPLSNTTIVEEIEKQDAILRSRAVSFLASGEEHLSRLLKEHPKIVDDFFGSEWARAFCGANAVVALRNRRLSIDELRRLRSALHTYYVNHFEAIDPGLPLASGSQGQRDFLRLSERYVPPDIRTAYEGEPEPLEPPAMDNGGASWLPRREATTSFNRRQGAATGRRAALRWLLEQDHGVLLGEPGAGKSSFARFVILDALSDAPLQPQISAKWAGCIPVWIPFGMWTAMVVELPTAHSLPDAVLGWVHRVGVPQWVEDALKQALDDERLLLVVDGLDEATNDVAANTALALLETFVSARAVPALVTSRPYAYRRMGALQGWAVGELELLSHEQQRQLAERWLFHSLQSVPASKGEPTPAETGALRATSRRECDAFFAELRRDPSLAELASNPLLLTGLIALRLSSVRLPRSRFKAYAALLDMLLQSHPKRRERATLARVGRGLLTDEGRSRALARLAFAMHEAPDPVAIGRDTAVAAVAAFLAEDLDIPFTDARPQAAEVVQVSEGSLGVLVRRSAQELTFAHRLFQEVLAARFVLGMPFAEQRQFVRSVCLQPHWREVLLCLLSWTERPDEVELLVQDIESARPRRATRGHHHLLLAEVAFGDARTPAALARRLALETFRQIELGAEESTKRRAIDLVVSGLDADALRPRVLERFAEWFPSSHPYRAALFSAMGAWPREEATLDALWCGLHDEEDTNREAAARAFATLSADSPDAAERLERLALDGSSPEVVAAAIQSLISGWNQRKTLPQLLRAALRSGDTHLRLTAIGARVHRHEHNQDDLDALLEMLSPYSNRFVGQRAVAALIKGWPSRPDLQRRARESLSDGWNAPPKSLERDAAIAYLLHTAPQDTWVARYLADHFERDNFPDIYFNHAWDIIEQNFGGNPILVPAIEAWLLRRNPMLPDAARAARVVKSKEARRILLNHLGEPGSFWFWAVDALLDTWPGDAEVLARLKHLASDPLEAQHMAYALPQLFESPAECRRRLLSILSLERPARLDFVVRALQELGTLESDEEVLSAVLKRDFSREFSGHMRGMEVAAVIHAFPADGRVRELALGEIDRRYGELGVVGRTFGFDEHFRHRLRQISKPLPSSLRMLLAERLSGRASEDAAVLEMLSRYDSDTDPEVKVQASIGYYSAAGTEPERTQGYIERLSGDVGVGWMDMDERRQAALAGLLVLDRLDIVSKATESYGGGPIRLSLTKGLRTNRPLVAYLANNWARVQRSFGETRWQRFRDEAQALFDHVSAVSDPNLPVSRDLLDSVDLAAHDKSSALRLLARLRPRDPALRKRCLELLREPFTQGNSHHASAIMVAADIAAELFGHDGVFVSALAESAQRNADGAIVALTIMAPGHQALKVAYERIRGTETDLLIPASVSLMASCASAQNFIRYLASFLSRADGGPWEFPAICRRVLGRRLADDGDAYLRAIRMIRGTKDASLAVSASSLLNGVRRLPPEVLERCSRELEQDTIENVVSLTTMDMARGYVRSTKEVLLDILAIRD